MNEAAPPQADDGIPQPRRRARWRPIVRVASLLLWVAVLGYAVVAAAGERSLVAGATLAIVTLLFLGVNAQFLLTRMSSQRRLHRLMMRAHGSSYISELLELPNRNYLLAELRREMPRARAHNSPFTLVLISLDVIDDVRKRRGEDFAERAIGALVTLMRRITRNSDFIGHLEGGRFCTVLYDCTFEQSFTYLRRVPGSIAVSDGHRMLDVPVVVRLHEYDMESLYATDVLGEVELAEPLRRLEAPRPFSEAA